MAGGPNDFMIVRHVRMRGTNRDIGRKIAEIAKQRHGARPDSADPLVLRTRRDFYKRNYPTHYARAAGAAEAFDLTLDTANVDCTTVYINMGPPPGCSTVYYPSAYTEMGHSILSRNYDFTTATWAEIIGLPPPKGARAMTADVYVTELYPDDGYPSLFITPYDLLGGCMDGINSKGLSVALLADDVSSDKAEPAMNLQAGLSEIEVTRFLLDTCATVDEAKSALMSVKQYYSFLLCHYIIGDRSGNSFVWEYSAAHNREYITDGGGKPQAITNHLLCKHPTLENLPKEESPGSTFNRLRRLYEEVEKAGGKHSLETIKKTNAAVAVDPQCSQARPGRSVGRTLWHAIYDSQDLSLQADFYLGEDPDAANKQKRSGYVRFQLQPAGQRP